MTFRFIIIYLLLINPFRLYSQHWIALSSGLNGNVTCLFSDSSNNILYVGGRFTTAGGIQARGIARWDGYGWDSLGSGINEFNPCQYITKYQNKIYACGAFSTVGDLNAKYIATWNGLTWDSLPTSPNEAIFCGKEINNKLILGGTFTRVDTINSIFLATWDGNQWSQMNVGFDSSFIGGVFSLEEYYGNLIVGGNFLPIEDVLNWDGSIASPLATGIHGGLSVINSTVVYNNDLYIGGNFFQSDGNAGNNIMKWNGMYWSDVGGGINGHVYTLKVHDGLLYAGGVFTQAGNINASNIAVWNGTGWTNLDNSIFDNVITNLEFLNNELYVSGGFWNIDTITVNGIAKFTGNLSTLENIEKCFPIKIFPNPSLDKINIVGLNQNMGLFKYTIKDFVGKILQKGIIEVKNEEASIDMNEFTSGIYFVQLESNVKIYIEKIIKL